MSTKQARLIAGIALLAIAAGYFFFSDSAVEKNIEDLDPTPQPVTLSGVYVCLPYLDGSIPPADQCSFGLKTDDGTYYAVNFGASEGAMQQFQDSARITAEGFVVIKEALSSDQWAKYNMKGIFTITKRLEDKK